jgi:hypothetical protein
VGCDHRQVDLVPLIIANNPEAVQERIAVGEFLPQAADCESLRLVLGFAYRYDFSHATGEERCIAPGRADASVTGMLT